MLFTRLVARPFLTLLIAVACAVGDEPLRDPPVPDQPVELLPDLQESERAPDGLANVYAPDIVTVGNQLWMYYGGQGQDGHDRIHLAISEDGTAWQKQGIVFAPEGVNHVNDPSVVLFDNRFYLFYTRANAGVTDTIGLALSDDGRHWEDRGPVLKPAADAWDSLLVGRPSVLHDGTKFRLWYDGRKDLPMGAPDRTAPQSHTSRRYVGYAESVDGVMWRRHPNYVYSHDAGGVHVSRVRDAWIMVSESREGTRWAASTDGIAWEDRGLLAPKTQAAPFGHVTPFLRHSSEKATVYFGAARSVHWDRNTIMSVEVRLSNDDAAPSR
ncbi:MAG: hypothetical protein NXI04_01305 [Planctomycetaceae bacterium]|nr:hypothetical protein [Planctomycetaceae bacterium]